MRILLAGLGGFLLDLLFGDPECLTPIHPVVLIGKFIDVSEKALRRVFPKTPGGECFAGLLLSLLTAAGTWLFCSAVLYCIDRVSPILGFVLELIWCWQALAMKDLRVEAMRVQYALETGTVEDARAAVSRIVGRDTAALSEPGIARAAVETVAENFSDGITAPLLYMLLGGAPLALCYKSINTMDSMIGYKNERYLHFGRAAARLDDLANFIPARLSALLLITAAAVLKEDTRGAMRIWKRDRRKHESPNSAQCEAAMAGALGLRLCGPATYFGLLHDKPWIGDETRPIESGDIRRACRMEYAGSFMALLLLGGLRLIWAVFG